MDNLPMVPIPTIEGQERMNPEIMSFLMQASIAAQTAKMRLLEESKVPVGVRALKVKVTDEVKTVSFARPLISCTLINESQDAGVMYSVNSEEDLVNEVYLNAGQSITINTVYPVINSIHLKAEAGATATVELVGIEGKAA